LEKVLRLSESVYGSISAAALGEEAHHYKEKQEILFDRITEE